MSKATHTDRYIGRARYSEKTVNTRYSARNISKQRPNGGRELGFTWSSPGIMNRRRPRRKRTDSTPPWSRSGSTRSCHHPCSVRVAGRRSTANGHATFTHTSSHAFTTQGRIFEYGGLQYTRSSCQDCSSPSSSIVQYRGSLAFMCDAAASTVKANSSCSS